MEMDSDSDSDGSDVSDVSDISFSEAFEEIHSQWAEMIALQEHLVERMSRFSYDLSTPFQAVIEACHQASLKDVEETGRVTFGERLLRSLE